MRDSQISLADGRTLAYADIGRPDGACLFFFHGAPMSRLHLVPLEEQFVAAGIRVISPDRPGYGRSSPQPRRSLSDWPQDVAALADALGVDRLLVAGHSSGGPYAVACAALLPARVLGGIVLGGVTDMSWPQAWSGYLEGRIEIELMRLRNEEATLARCAEHFGQDGRGFLRESFDWPAPDLEFLEDESAANALSAAVIEAFHQGVVGYAQDVHIEGLGWSFDPGGVAAPLDVIHGELDALVPLAHSQHTVRLVRTARLRILPGHGHLTTLPELPQAAAALLSSAG